MFTGDTPIESTFTVPIYLGPTIVWSTVVTSRWCVPQLPFEVVSVAAVRWTLLMNTEYIGSLVPRTIVCDSSQPDT